MKYWILAAAVAVVLLGMAYINLANKGYHTVILERVPSVTAIFADGTYSTAEMKRGACSSHGGVAEWIIKNGP